jgi:thioredoxin
MKHLFIAFLISLPFLAKTQLIKSDSLDVKKVPSVLLKDINGKEVNTAAFGFSGPVVISFWATWCAPCKKMKPYLDEISRDMAGKVEVVRINADENPQLCKELGVDGLPVLKVYKKKTETWSNIGYIEKDKVVEQLK